MVAGRPRRVATQRSRFCAVPCQSQTASATLPRGAPTLGGFHVGRDFAAKAVWLVGGGSDCRHGARARRVRASRGADCRHGASAITKARTAHGAANAAPRSSCRAGLPARRSSRHDVNSLPSTGSPQWAASSTRRSRSECGERRVSSDRLLRTLIAAGDEDDVLDLISSM
jgi:hypothetical protein